MTGIGVLCARVRVEEKQIIAALADAGVVAMPVPPASTPMPPGPAPAELAALGVQREVDDVTAVGVMIDRCQNRSVAVAMLPLLRLNGVDVISAGLAATGTRVEVATALTRAGLPRPQTLVGFSESTALAAAARLGYPATLMPQVPGSATTTLLDHDTAEAVIEHRTVLGTRSEAIVLLQSAAPGPHELGRHHVVASEVIAVEGSVVDGRAQTLAISAARVLGAQSIAVDIALVDGRLVIWDVAPVADFRASRLTGNRSVGEALASFATAGAGVPVSARAADERVSSGQLGWEVEVSHGVAGVSITA